MMLHLLAEGRGWAVVAKPPGVAVIPARNEPAEASLRSLAERALGRRIWIVHRLDRGTSGALLFATDAATHRALSLAFERGEVRKSYLAITRGAPAESEGTIDVALHAARKGKVRPARPAEPGAKPARTEYTVAWTSPSALGLIAGVIAAPRTGRQHQIRVHLRAVGSPLLVDPLYGGTARVTGAELGLSEPLTIERLTLHATRLEFDDPTTAAPVAVESPLAPDLAHLERLLRRG